MTKAVEPHEIIRDACGYWNRARGDRAMPSRVDIDPTEIPRLLPHMILTDVDHDPIDFRFRLIGTYVDRHVNGRYTGERLRHIPKKGPGSLIWRTLNHVIETGAPHIGYLDYHGPTEGIHGVEEAILPLGRDGRVEMLMNILVFVREPGDLLADRRFYHEEPRVEASLEDTGLFRLVFDGSDVTPTSPAAFAAIHPNRPNAS